MIAQITISTIKGAFAPAPATNGSAAKAAQDSAVNAATNTPSRPSREAIRSAAIPIAVSVIVKIA